MGVNADPELVNVLVQHHIDVAEARRRARPAPTAVLPCNCVAGPPMEPYVAFQRWMCPHEHPWVYRSSEGWSRG
jgi:hypothetical protein